MSTAPPRTPAQAARGGTTETVLALYQMGQDDEYANMVLAWPVGVLRHMLGTVDGVKMLDQARVQRARLAHVIQQHAEERAAGRRSRAWGLALGAVALVGMIAASGR